MLPCIEKGWRSQVTARLTQVIMLFSQIDCARRPLNSWWILKGVALCDLQWCDYKFYYEHRAE